MINITPRKFLLFVLAWLPATFALWYWSAAILLVPVQWLSELVLTNFFEHAVKGITQQGINFEVTTVFGSDLLKAYQYGQPVGEVIFSINALKYGYGVPLIAAMILASPNLWQRKAKFLIIAFVLLLPIQVWGICCETLIVIAFKMGEAIRAQMHMTRLYKEVLALSYQLGYLILPAIAPLLIWAMMHKHFILKLMPSPSASSSKA